MSLFSVYCFLFLSSCNQADEQNHVLSEKARLHLEKYSFPVEMMVALPNGTIVNILLLPSVNIGVTFVDSQRLCKSVCIK